MRLLPLLLIAACAAPRIEFARDRIVRYRVTEAGRSFEVDSDGWYGERRSFPGLGFRDAYNEYVTIVGQNAPTQKIVWFEIDGDVYLEGFGVADLFEAHVPPLLLLPRDGRRSWRWAGEVRRAESRALVTRSGGRVVERRPDAVVEYEIRDGVGLARVIVREGGVETLRVDLVAAAPKDGARG